MSEGLAVDWSIGEHGAITMDGFVIGYLYAHAQVSINDAKEVWKAYVKYGCKPLSQDEILDYV